MPVCADGDHLCGFCGEDERCATRLVGSGAKCSNCGTIHDLLESNDVKTVHPNIPQDVFSHGRLAMIVSACKFCDPEGNAHPTIKESIKLDILFFSSTS